MFEMSLYVVLVRMEGRRDKGREAMVKEDS